jgi:uncharacterized protein
MKWSMSDLDRATTERLEFIDSLRGFALFGVFWANLLIFSGISYMSNQQRASLFSSRLDSFAYFVERFFIENKFMGLFSFLFGISFWLFLSRARARGGPATSLFYRRIFWLFVIGLVHGWLFWCFDILRFYALWAILLPLFLCTTPRRLLYVALATSVLLPALVSGLRVWLITPVEPAMDFDALALAAFSRGSYRDFLVANWKYDWYLTIDVGQISYQVAVFGRLLLGLYVARAFNLWNLAVHRALLQKVLVVGGLLGVVGSTVFAGDLLTSDNHIALLSFVRRFLVESGQLGLTLCYAAALALAFLTLRGRSVIRLLAPIGQMALTWYLLQTAFGIWMFYGFAHGPALMGKLGPASLAALALTGFLIQVMLARVWRRQFRFGPAEWLWRTLTYWKVQPFKALTPAAGEPRQAPS